MDSPERRLMEAELGHQFADSNLLRDALTHKSYAHEQPKLAPNNNERLEFLGDAVLGMTIAAELYERFPEAPEGVLTRRRAKLVCEATLAEVACELGLSEGLLLGRGEALSGGREKPRLLASVFEAVLGAVYLDGGMEATRALVARVFAARVDEVPTQPVDPKSRIQELAQGRGWPTPTYRVLETHGADHERVFRVEIVIGDEGRAIADGRSKAEAERAAARAALAELLT